MSPESFRLAPSPDAIATRLGDEIVLVQIETDRIYALNVTGARIWELVCDRADRAEMERRLLEEFDAIPDDVERAVDELLAALVAHRLLVESS